MDNTDGKDSKANQSQGMPGNNSNLTPQQLAAQKAQNDALAKSKAQGQTPADAQAAQTAQTQANNNPGLNPANRNNPQVNVGQNANPKYANMPTTDYSKIQTPSHVTAIQDKIDQDGLLSGKTTAAIPHATTQAEAQAKDAKNAEDLDDETLTNPDGSSRSASRSAQRATVEGNTPNVAGSTPTGSNPTGTPQANQGGTLGGVKK
jgi:hypothetical protein